MHATNWQETARQTRAATTGDGQVVSGSAGISRPSTYCTYHGRWERDRLRYVSQAVLCMERYAMWRLSKSKGAPVSLNQSAMGAYFAKDRRENAGKKGYRFGPGLRTIQRSWRVFMHHMNTRGYRFVRAHSKGVALNGKRPSRHAKHRKLGWVAFATKWEEAGNQILRFMEGANKKIGAALSSRWVRRENLELVSEKAVCEANHSAKDTGNALSSGEHQENLKQVAPGFIDFDPQHVVPLSVQLRQKHARWRLPGWAARKIWAISKKYLDKTDAAPVAYRAIDLWRASYNANSLFVALERAVGWAAEADSGNRGKIAAAALAGLTMGTADPWTNAPSSEDFWRWIETNAPAWRTKTTRRIKDVCAQNADKAPERVEPEEWKTIREAFKKMFARDEEDEASNPSFA